MKISANRERSYRVAMCEGLSQGSVSSLLDTIGARKSLLVTTPTVAKLYTNRLMERLLESRVDVGMVIIQSTEESKTLSEVEKLCQECFRAGLDRESVLIGIGGGICTDLVTMAASLVRRGIRYIRIPTTLIGLIDAGIGIKGAVNLPNKKSALGCFYPPERVLLDPGFLRTLSPHFLSGGLAEAIKVAVVADPNLFGLLESFSRELLETPQCADGRKMNELVWQSSVRLLEELEPNLYEDQTYRRALDFGHTFSPMIESESGFQVSHGAAVAIDIALSSCIAFEMGLLPLVDWERILKLVAHTGSPTYSKLLTLGSCREAMAEIERHRGGYLNLVVPVGIGSVMVIPKSAGVPLSAVHRALEFLRRQAAHGAVPRSKSVFGETPVLGRTDRPGPESLVATGTSG